MICLVTIEIDSALMKTRKKFLRQECNLKFNSLCQMWLKIQGPVSCYTLLNTCGFAVLSLAAFQAHNSFFPLEAVVITDWSMSHFRLNSEFQYVTFSIASVCFSVS